MTSDAQVLDVSWDWMTACDVQERFMRQAGPTIGTLSYSARCRQMRALGGDFYDFMPLSHERLAFAIGDASGKGLAAALMISNVQSSLRTAATFIGDDGPAVLDGGESPGARSIARRPLRHAILRRFRRSDAHAANMLMQATIRRWWCDETAQSSRWQRVECRSGYSPIPRTREKQFS